MNVIWYFHYIHFTFVVCHWIDNGDDSIVCVFQNFNLDFVSVHGFIIHTHTKCIEKIRNNRKNVIPDDWLHNYHSYHYYFFFLFCFSMTIILPIQPKIYLFFLPAHYISKCQLIELNFERKIFFSFLIKPDHYYYQCARVLMFI